MTNDKPKLNGCAIAVLVAFAAFGVVAFWICIEIGQWIGRQ